MSAPRLAVLDLSPVAAARGEGAAVRETIDLARAAERLGYHRYWLAEHHGGAMLASSAPEILIGHVAGATERMRIGSGGMMLPNHAPLRVAEQFKTLEALHPGRIDLGIGRAPGTDQMTALAIRRSREAMLSEELADQLAELLCCAGVRPWPQGHPFSHVRAAPFDVPLPPVFLLGSSGHSAALAAEAGFPFAFAAQINPAPAAEVLASYREGYRPSSENPEPYAILAHNVVVADDDDQALRLAAPARVAFRRMRSGRPGPLPSVEDALAEERSEGRRPRRSARVIAGSPASVREQLEPLLEESGADELMAMANLHEPADRVRSYELLAAAFTAGSGARRGRSAPGA